MSDPRATAVNLAGRVTSTSRGSVGAPNFTGYLAGRITSTTWANAQPAPLPLPNLMGRITAATRLVARPAPLAVSLAGTVTSTVRLVGYTPHYLSASIYAQATAAVNFPVFVTPPTQLVLAYGYTRAVARLVGLPLFIEYINLAGSITATSAAQLRYPRFAPYTLLLSGSIKSASSAWLGHGPYYVSNVAGQIRSNLYLRGRAGPWMVPGLVGHIDAAMWLYLDVAEVQYPLPPYPPPFLTYTTLDYLNRITSEHNQKPKYLDSVGYSLDPEVQDAQLVAGFSGLFDIDYCVGEQEDFTGQWIGKSRYIELPMTFFTWDQVGAGWNEANWRGPGDAPDMIERLDDYHYRLLLFSNIIANHWDGSIPKAYEAWDELFKYTGLKVIIQDYGNMTMLYGLMATETLDLVLVSLFLTGQMDLRPEGVQLIDYALPAKIGAPFFSWDSASDIVQGWDTGSWATMVKPGTLPPPYIPP